MLSKESGPRINADNLADRVPLSDAGILPFPFHSSGTPDPLIADNRIRTQPERFG